MERTNERSLLTQKSKFLIDNHMSLWSTLADKLSLYDLQFVCVLTVLNRTIIEKNWSPHVPFCYPQRC